MFGITEPTGSHLPMLELALRVSHGLVIEHGAGLYSSPLLARMGKPVLCWEPVAAWREWATWFYDGRAEVVETFDWGRLRDAGLVFIDGPAKERGPLLDACLTAGVSHIVVHDTHERCFKEYGWRPDHFTAPGYVVTHDVYKRKYRTTLWTKQLGVPFDP
jgi:hypothetical protein